MKYVAPILFTAGFGLLAFMGCSTDAENLFGGDQSGGEGGEGGEGGSSVGGAGTSMSGTTTTSATNATTTAAGTTSSNTTASSSATSGPATSSATTGGGIIRGIGCNTNGQCTEQGDDCVCPDCDNNDYCSNPANCTADGVCDAFYEGCVCPDCLTQHPQCVDN